MKKATSIKTLLLGSLMVMLCACGVKSSASDACALFRPIYPAKADYLTDANARIALANARAGREVCGW